MARVGILFGVLLCVLTSVAMLTSMDKSAGQFLPMMLGIPILFCSVVGLNPHRRRNAISVAAIIATMGVLIGAGTIVGLMPESGSQEDDQQRLVVISVMLVMCLVFAAISARWISLLPKRLAIPLVMEELQAERLTESPEAKNPETESPETESQKAESPDPETVTANPTDAV